MNLLGLASLLDVPVARADVVLLVESDDRNLVVGRVLQNSSVF